MGIEVRGARRSEPGAKSEDGRARIKKRRAVRGLFVSCSLSFFLSSFFSFSDSFFRVNRTSLKYVIQWDIHDVHVYNYEICLRKQKFNW